MDMRTTLHTLSKKFSSLFNESPRLAIFSSISLGVFIAGFLFFSFRYLLPNTQVAIAQEGKIENQRGKQEESAKISQTGKTQTRKPILEVHIANTGMAYIQGAKVLSVSGSTIVVETVWNAVKLQ